MTLTPTPVVDKNGKLTTVYKKTSGNPTASFAVPHVASNYEEVDEFESNSNPLTDHVNDSLKSIAVGLKEISFIGYDGSAKFTIDDMAIPEVARDNCYEVSKSVLKSGALKSIDNGNEATLIHVHDGDEQGHTAIYLSDANGNEAVIDFTARQFDHDTDFPLVLTRDDWEGFMESSLGWIDSTVID